MKSEMEWMYLYHTKKALYYLLEEMEEDVIKIVLEKYNQMPFYSKLLIHIVIKDHQNISPNNQQIFLR